MAAEGKIPYGSWGKNRLVNFMLDHIEEHRSQLKSQIELVKHENLENKLQRIGDRYQDIRSEGKASGLAGFFSCPALQSAKNRIERTCSPKMCVQNHALSRGNKPLNVNR
jgi:hypothetical protein